MAENHHYEGVRTIFTCAECWVVSEVEGDAKGETAECEVCGHVAPIE